MSKGISIGYVPLAALTVSSPIKESFASEPVVQGPRYGHDPRGRPEVQHRGRPRVESAQLTGCG